VQAYRDRYITNRLVAYISRLHSNQLPRGGPYRLLQPVIGITFLKWAYKATEHNYYVRANLRDERTNELESDRIETIMLDLTKLPDLSDNGELLNWLKFFNAKTKEELSMCAKLSADVAEAVELVKRYNEDDATWYAALLADLAQDTYNDTLDDRWESGREEGEEIGVEKGKQEALRETAKNLLAINIPIEQIVIGTGLTIEEIEALR
jgi:predicted transposase/invertase (TIGR01784 family)